MHFSRGELNLFANEKDIRTDINTIIVQPTER